MKLPIVLFDTPEARHKLKPFTLTRPLALLRVGILTIAEKWQRMAGTSVHFLTEEYLSAKYSQPPYTGKAIYILGSICPDTALLNAISTLSENEALVYQGRIIAACTSLLAYEDQSESLDKLVKKEYVSSTLVWIQEYWNLFQNNGSQIRSDVSLITQGRLTQPIDDEHTRVYNVSQIFIEEGVKIRAAVLNAENGPIYIGKNCEIQEGSTIRGPFAMGEGSVLNMGSKIRPDVTLGPYCKVGGEVSNSIVMGYSNKAHDGFLGNSVVGEWCNLGADTNTSNLKNNYSSIRMWSYLHNAYTDTGLTFCGIMMGDHSKCGINTMFNTGTVIGVSANIFGGHFPPKFIPSFAWGGDENAARFELPKALDVAKRVMARRNLQLDGKDIDILTYLFTQAC